MTEIQKAERVASIVAEHYGLTLEQLRGPGRPERLAWPRQVAMALIYERTDLGSQRIAELLKRKDHGTVLWAIDVVRQRLATDERSFQAVQAILAKIFSTEAIAA